MLKNADSALYEAKEKGRNRVVSYEEDVFASGGFMPNGKNCRRPNAVRLITGIVNT